MADYTNDNEGASSSSLGGGETQGPNSSEDLRAALMHPLMVKSTILRTMPIEELIVELRRTVILREQGCCFTATSGYGKTYALALAEQELRGLFKDVPIYRHLTENQQYPSIRAFFKRFLTTVGETNIKGETYDLRVRLTNILIDQGRASEMKLDVLLIDEAQEMALQDFCFLKDIGNDLETAGVQLVVAMIGQEPEFSLAIDKLHSAGRLDLISRFTLRRMKFRGLSSQTDIAVLLELIDQQTYPAGTSCAWPQFFVPKAWASGFRMKDQAGRLREALEKLLPNNGIALGVPARQLFVAIRRYVVEIADLERVGKPFTDGLWDMVVQYALIHEAAEISDEGLRRSEKAGQKNNWRASL